MPTLHVRRTGWIATCTCRGSSSGRRRTGCSECCGTSDTRPTATCAERHKSGHDQRRRANRRWHRRPCAYPCQREPNTASASTSSRDAVPAIHAGSVGDGWSCATSPTSNASTACPRPTQPPTESQSVSATPSGAAEQSHRPSHTCACSKHPTTYNPHKQHRPQQTLHLHDPLQPLQSRRITVPSTPRRPTHQTPSIYVIPRILYIRPSRTNHPARTRPPTTSTISNH